MSYQGFHSLNSAGQALQAFAHHDPDQFPDIILMDYYLGDGTGTIDRMDTAAAINW